MLVLGKKLMDPELHHSSHNCIAEAGCRYHKVLQSEVETGFPQLNQERISLYHQVDLSMLHLFFYPG